MLANEMVVRRCEDSCVLLREKNKKKQGLSQPRLRLVSSVFHVMAGWREHQRHRSDAALGREPRPEIGLSMHK